VCWIFSCNFGGRGVQTPKTPHSCGLPLRVIRDHTVDIPSVVVVVANSSGRIALLSNDHVFQQLASMHGVVMATLLLSWRSRTIHLARSPPGRRLYPSQLRPVLDRATRGRAARLSWQGDARGSGWTDLGRARAGGGAPWCVTGPRTCGRLRQNGRRRVGDGAWRAGWTAAETGRGAADWRSAARRTPHDRCSRASCSASSDEVPA